MLNSSQVSYEVNKVIKNSKNRRATENSIPAKLTKSLDDGVVNHYGAYVMSLGKLFSNRKIKCTLFLFLCGEV